MESARPAPVRTEKTISGCAPCSVEPFEEAMLHSVRMGAISSGGERFLHTEEATGSIPVSPTILFLNGFPTSSSRCLFHPSRIRPTLDRTDSLS